MNVPNWTGQITTGHGAMALVGTVLACLNGQLSWAAATPLLAVGVVGLLWPENAAAAAAARTLGTDAQPAVADLDAVLRGWLQRERGKLALPPASAANAAAPTATAGSVAAWLGITMGVLAGLTMACFWAPALAPFGICAALVLATIALVWLVQRRRLRGNVAGLVGCLALLGCTAPQVAANLQANGVSAATADKIGTVVSTAVADGTLFCQFDSAIAAVRGVNVKGASAQTVAAACATAQIIGGIASALTPVPVPPPATPAAVPIATVPAAAAAAVAASVKA